MRILLVEDEAEMAGALASALKRYDMIVDHVPTLAEADEAISRALLLDPEDPANRQLATTIRAMTNGERTNANQTPSINPRAAQSDVSRKPPRFSWISGLFRKRA